MSYNHFKALIGFVLIFLFCNNIQAQQLAFPGAEGFGKNAKGGRGGDAFYVTSLLDNGSGTLRDAVSKPNRVIIFTISGTIHLVSPLRLLQSNITIAGQTAPGDGICVADNVVSIEANDVIIRYVRFRLGDLHSIIDDALHGNGGYKNIIVDHCSMSWSIDETGSFYDNKNFTLQWCILSESLYNSVDPKGTHGYGGIWGGQNVSFHHNLLAHHSSRNPRFCGSRYTGDSINELVDERNNVIYNWGNINSAYGGEGGNYNMVNNYYKPGPATTGNSIKYRILQYTSYYHASDAKIYPDTVFGGKFYIDGNYVEGNANTTADNWNGNGISPGVQSDGFKNAAILMSRNRRNTPFAFEPIRVQTAQQAYLSVLDSAGAILPRRDTVDRRILNETRTGTATFGGSYNNHQSKSGMIDSQNEVGGWPTLNSTTYPNDYDGDGVPDWWETMSGLNPLSYLDGKVIASNGYSNLENYINGIPSPDTQPYFVSNKALRDTNNVGKVTFTINWAKDLFTFGVYRSTDSIHFTRLSEIPSNVNSYKFNYNDSSLPTANKIFYRIASYAPGRTDTVWSNICRLLLPTDTVVVVTPTASTLLVYPNPAKSILHIRYPAITSKGNVILYSSVGKMVLDKDVAIGSTGSDIIIGNLSFGVYYVKLVTSDGVSLVNQFFKVN